MYDRLIIGELSSHLLALTAITTIIYGVAKSYRYHTPVDSSSQNNAGTANGLTHDSPSSSSDSSSSSSSLSKFQQEIFNLPNWVLLIILPVVSLSTVFLLSKYIMHSENAMLLVSSILSLYSFTFVLIPLYAFILENLLNLEINLFNGYKFQHLCSLVNAIIFTVVWCLFRPNWLNNIMTMSIVITALTLVRVNNLKKLSLLLLLVYIYDLFFVNFGEQVYGKSQLARAAAYMDLNRYPHYIAFQHKHWDAANSSIYLTDMIFPGLVLCQFKFFDKYYQVVGNRKYRPIGIWELGYFHLGIGMYALGLLIASIRVTVGHVGHPHLLYILPFLILVPLYLAKRRGLASKLLAPIPRGKQQHHIIHEMDDRIPSVREISSHNSQLRNSNDQLHLMHNNVNNVYDNDHHLNLKHRK